MKLFLDDIRDPRHVYPDQKNEDWVVVRSYEEMQRVLFDIRDRADIENWPKEVSFDYVLGHDSKDGSECAKLLVNMCRQYGLELPICHVHSSYPGSFKIISEIISRYAKYAGIEASIDLIHHNY